MARGPNRGSGGVDFRKELETLAAGRGVRHSRAVPGTVYPLHTHRPTESRGEKEVLAWLRKALPDGYVAWHSIGLRVGADWCGEGDIVVLTPKCGVLVLEVKSGRVDLHEGIWRQNGTVMRKPPIAQAHGYVRKLVETLAEQGVVGVPFGVACFFPDTPFSSAPKTGELRDVVLCARDLERGDDTVGNVFEGAIRYGKRPPPFPKIRHAIHELWGERWTGGLDVPDQIADAEKRLFRLDREQLDVLLTVEENARASVDGGAGTGKTVVARNLALRKARQGKRVLYLCFTDSLAYAVDAQFAAARREGHAIEARPIRRHARALLDAAGLAKAGTDEQKFGQHISMEAVVDGLVHSRARPDLVVVDESQDLKEEDWLFVDALAKGVWLWTFGDEKQRFLSTDPMPDHLAEEMMRVRLRKQRRSPGAIAKLAERYVGGSAEEVGVAAGDDEEGESADDAEAVKTLACAPTRILATVEKEIKRLLSKGVKAGEIAVLSLAGKTHARVAGLEKIGDVRVVVADAPDAATNVVADTCLRFKGLERPFVIVVDLPEDCNKPMSGADVRMHIAVTRATMGVVIVGSEGAVARVRERVGAGVPSRVAR
jgi:hypothetical protein